MLYNLFVLIGHHKILKVLDKVIENDRVSHAYLFVGLEHIGKFEVARSFASKLVGITPEKLDIYPDFILVQPQNEETEGKKSIGVDEVRALRAKLQLSSFLKSWQLVIIDKAETLTLQAVSALLKILEEPHKKVCFILLAKHKDLLPKTIISRCQVFRFSLVPDEEIYNGLVNAGAKRDEAKFIAKLALGRPGIALNLLQNQKDFENIKAELLGILTLDSKSISDKFEFGSNLVKNYDLDAVIDKIITILRHEMLLHYNCKELTFDGLEKAQPKNCAKLLEKILYYKSLLHLNVNKNLILENILINL